MTSGSRGVAPWRIVVPLAIAGGLALLPTPSGLAPHAWLYFALFTGVVAALVTEPLPNPAVGLIGVTAAAVLARFVLQSPADLAKPGFNAVSDAVNWALSGFASNTVWLVGAAFMFAMGYEKTGLGRRIALLLVRALGKNTLSLGYAATVAEALLATCTPSNTARGSIVMAVVTSLCRTLGASPEKNRKSHGGEYLGLVGSHANLIAAATYQTGT